LLLLEIRGLAVARLARWACRCGSAVLGRA
jgi:hypothetical protein